MYIFMCVLIIFLLNLIINLDCSSIITIVVYGFPKFLLYFNVFIILLSFNLSTYLLYEIII